MVSRFALVALVSELAAREAALVVAVVAYMQTIGPVVAFAEAELVVVVVEAADVAVAAPEAVGVTTKAVVAVAIAGPVGAVGEAVGTTDGDDCRRSQTDPRVTNGSGTVSSRLVNTVGAGVSKALVLFRNALCRLAARPVGDGGRASAKEP